MYKRLKDKLSKRISTTLIEIIIVLIIIGIIAALAFPGFQKAKENAISKEAISSLKLIAAAEKIYRMENDGLFYFTCADTAACSSGLRLDLTPRNWTYTVGVSSAGVATLRSTWVDNAACNYTLTSANFDADPVKSAACPAGMQ